MKGAAAAYRYTSAPRPYRLTLRPEGDHWNAYLAPEGVIEGAIKIGSIPLALVKDNQEVQRAFVEVIQTILSKSIAAAGGEIAWPGEPQPVPENEGAGTI